MNKELFCSNQIWVELQEEYIQKDGLYFYYGTDLKKICGDRYIVFGDVFSYDDEHKVKDGLLLLDQLDCDDEAIERMLYYWGGRFVLYYKKKFFMDNCGLLGLFYYNGNDGWFITSSLKVLSQDLKFKKIDKAPEFQWGGDDKLFSTPPNYVFKCI